MEGFWSVQALSVPLWIRELKNVVALLVNSIVKVLGRLQVNRVGKLAVECNPR